MCPDQLFAALSAWYMCAISFNRWYSVCRPSSYYLATTSKSQVPSRDNRANIEERYSNVHENTKTKFLSRISRFISSDFIYCLTRDVRYRQHIQAFRGIGIITLLGFLCCLYPIFMHELRLVVPNDINLFDSRKSTGTSYPTVWKRCYYSRKHEYAYDIIGLILSCFLHILPLTFVTAISFMIILQLRQRQQKLLYTNQMKKTPTKQKKNNLTFKIRTTMTKHSSKTIENLEIKKTNSQVDLIVDQNGHMTPTKLHGETNEVRKRSPFGKCAASVSRRQSRDRTITLMLVSIALFYIILTLPYRMFWSYNVYIKRMHPKKLTSQSYLLKMHHIDHLLRTIRNVHYGTNFISFILLSNVFREKFHELCVRRFVNLYYRLFPRQQDSAFGALTERRSEIPGDTQMYRKENHTVFSSKRTGILKTNFGKSLEHPLNEESALIAQKMPSKRDALFHE